MTTADAPKSRFGCTSSFLVFLVVVAAVPSVYLYTTREERAAERERERTAKACLSEVDKRLGECLEKEGIFKDEGSPWNEESADCFYEWLNGQAQCGQEGAFSVMKLFHATEVECQKLALSREKKCIGEAILSGSTAEQAKSSCREEREAGFKRCAEWKSKYEK